MRFKLKKGFNPHVWTYVAIAILCIAALAWAAETTIFGSLKVQASGDSETYQLSVYTSGGTRVFSIDSSGNVYFAGTISATGLYASPNTTYGYSTHTNTTADEVWTLSATETKSNLLRVYQGTGSPIIVPTTPTACTAGRVYFVRNQASSVSVVIKVSGQTGVTVASAKTAAAWCDGTDFLRLTADASN